MNAITKKAGSGFRWVIQPLLVFGVLIIGFIAAKGISSNDHVAPNFEKRAYEPLVEVQTTQLVEAPIRIQASGALQAQTRVDLVAQVEGRVLEVHPSFRSGGHFAAGEVLVRIEPTDFELAVAQAQADVSSSKTALETLQAEAQSAELEWRAMNGEKPIPTLVAKKPQLSEAQARIDAAEANLRGAQLDLERTAMSLPWAGRIVSTQVDVGGVVNRNQAIGSAYSVEIFEIAVPLRQEQLRWVHLAGEPSNGASSDTPPLVLASVLWPGASPQQLEELVVSPMEQAIAAVEGIRSLRSYASAGLAYVEVHPTGEFDAQRMLDRVGEALDTLQSFPPREAQELQLNQAFGSSTANVILHISGSEVSLRAHAVRLESELDSMSRFASLVLQVEAGRVPLHLRERLMPGLFADVQIEGERVRGVTSIPRSALRKGSLVWRIIDGRLGYFPVQSVYVDRDAVWVRGIPEDSQIVISDLEVVTDGMLVRVADALPTPTTEAAPTSAGSGAQ